MERKKSTSANRTRNSGNYMSATSSSVSRQKNTLNLRDKIFELHDAVKELQTSKPTQAIVVPDQSKFS